MVRDTPAILIGIGVEVIAAIFGVVVRVMPRELALSLVIVGLALITWGVVSLIRGRRADRSIERKIDRLLSLGENQPNMDNMTAGEAIGVTETASGKPVLLTPIHEPQILGDVWRGTKQTFSGLDTDGTVFLRIPGLGDAAITPTIRNEEVEVDFKFDISIPSQNPITLTVSIGDKIDFSQYIPAYGKGFFTQKSKTRINKQINNELWGMSLEIDTGVTQ